MRNRATVTGVQRTRQPRRQGATARTEPGSRGKTSGSENWRARSSRTARVPPPDHGRTARELRRQRPVPRASKRSKPPRHASPGAHANGRTRSFRFVPFHSIPHADAHERNGEKRLSTCRCREILGFRRAFYSVPRKARMRWIAARRQRLRSLPSVRRHGLPGLVPCTRERATYVVATTEREPGNLRIMLGRIMAR